MLGHVVTLVKLAPPPQGLTGYLLRITTDPKVAAPGWLIACTRCLNSTHCAPFVTAAELAQRQAAFEAKHKDCR